MKLRRRIRWILISVAILASLGGSLAWVLTREQPLSPRDIARRSFPSVVSITLQDRAGEAIGFGSGFVVRPGIVATNFHVLEGAAGGHVRRIGRPKDRFRIAGLVAWDRERDLALLSVEGLDAPPLEIGAGDSLLPGDPIYIVGSPEGLEGTFSEGVLSARRNDHGIWLLQHTAPISSGSSGSPVLGTGGRVIGVAAGAIDGGQNLNFAIPARYLRLLLERQGAVVELAKVLPPRPTKSRTRVASRPTFAPVGWVRRLVRSFRGILPDR